MLHGVELRDVREAHLAGLHERLLGQHAVQSLDRSGPRSEEPAMGRNLRPREQEDPLLIAAPQELVMARLEMGELCERSEMLPFEDEMQGHARSSVNEM